MTIDPENAAGPDPAEQPEVEPSPEIARIADEHDPTGLELARRIAGAIGMSSKPARRGPASRPTSPGRPRPRPGRDDRDPKLIGPVLEHLVSDRGWTTEISVHSLFGRWSALVGEVNAAHSTPESYTDGVLVVRAESTAWATSLRTIAHQILARLNDELGEGTVTRIKVIGPNAPSWKHGRRSVRGRGPRDTYG